MGVMAQQAAEALISSLVLGAAIAALAWAVLVVVPPGKAGSRFLVWFTALAAIVVVPVVQILVRLSSWGPTSGLGLSQDGSAFIVLPPNWAAYVLWGWVVLSIIGLTRVLVGVLHVRRLHTTSSIIDPAELSSEARETIARAAQRRTFELRTSGAVRVPMAIGFLKPAILIPTDLFREFSPAQLSHVLLHETTHLLRYDDWTNLVQKIARAVLFFHPAVWLLENKLTLEREMACDEAVVAHTSDPRSYAECLALLAERSVLKRSLALVQAAVSRLRHTTLRVKALMSSQHKTTARAWGAVTGVIGVVAFSTALVQAPNLVSFQESAPPAEIAARTVANWPTEKEPAPALVVPAKFQPPGTKTGRPSDPANAGMQARSVPIRAPRSRDVEQHPPGFVLAADKSEQSVPVLVTTEMIVERSGPDMSEQVWGLWQVTIYYSTAEKKAAVVPRKT